MMCKPLVLSSGEWILPASTWRLTDNSARLIVSEDQGKTWQVRGACHIPVEVRDFDEHMIIEKNNGNPWDVYPYNLWDWDSNSKDRWYYLGTTRTFRSLSILQPVFLFANFNQATCCLVKHGPIDEQIKRSHLTAFISQDDGDTWKGGLMLDERVRVSYPDGQQTKDGTIYIIYDYARRDEMNILFASFREDDVLSGNVDSETVSLRNIVSNPK